MTNSLTRRLHASALAVLAGASLLPWAPDAAAQQVAARRALTFEDFATMRGVSDPQPSPDGRWVLYAVRTTDVAANRRATTTFLRAAAGGGSPRAWPDDTTRATEARWSPDGRRIAYTAGGQLWIANVDGSQRQRLTTLNGGASGPVWSPTGTLIAFTSAVYPDCRADACNVQRDSARAASPVKARVADQLMFRHWNVWDEGTRSHLFVVSPEGTGLRDVTEGVRYDVPPPPFGGSEGYAFAPDGQSIAFTAKDAGREEAWSTDVNLYEVPVGGGQPRVLTAANRGADQNPVYSPDGRWIAYASQLRAGFESDRFRLMVLDRSTGRSRELLPTFDRNADAYFFAPDMRAVFVQTIDQGREKLYRFRLQDGRVTDGAVVVSEGNNVAFAPSRDGRTLVWLRDYANRPAEVYVTPTLAGPDGAPLQVMQLSHENDAAVARLALNPAEEFWFRGAGGDSVQGFVVRPPNFEEGRRYPVVLLVHGGPQGAFLDQWHGRWNYQMFAAPGNAVVIINPRGSIGYGQRFVDEVSQDWGGRAYADLMRGVDAALARHRWMDSTRMGAAGGSYGGYMVNWMAGHTNRFKAFVSHAGPFNLEHMATATEELWFTEWENGGSLWEPRALAQMRRWSPHLFARNFRTPMLVTGGQLDFRVPYTESISLFTTLQRRNVPSRLVLFPDEGHWITRPQNQRLWWKEVQDWFGRHLRSGEPLT